ncbi:MAG: redoxin domain-containing protein, partial [Bacteroidota bacterium]
MQRFLWILPLALLCSLLWQCNAAADSPAATAAPTSSTPSEALVIPAAGPPNFTVEVAGMADGPVTLVGMLNDKQFALAEAPATGGRVTFQQAEPFPQGLYFLLLPNGANFKFLLAEDQEFTLKTSLAQLGVDMQVEGNIDNELLFQTNAYEQSHNAKQRPLNQQLKAYQPTDPQYQQIMDQLQTLQVERKNHLEGIFAQHPNTFFTTFKRAGQNPLLRRELPEEKQVPVYRMEFWDNVDLRDDRLMRTPVIYNKMKRYFTELTPQQPDSIIVALERLIAQIPNIKGSEYYKYFVNWVALEYTPTETTLMDSEAVWVHIVKNHFTYERAFWSDSTNTYSLQLRAEEMGNSLIGQLGPNVKAPDPSGTLRAVYDLKAPYIVVYLYNPDCEHCQEQTPVLVNLHRQWQSQATPLADVYAIAVDTEDALWKNYIAKTGMNWTNVFDPTNQAIYKTYYVNVTP